MFVPAEIHKELFPTYEADQMRDGSVVIFSGDGIPITTVEDYLEAFYVIAGWHARQVALYEGDQDPKYPTAKTVRDRRRYAENKESTLLRRLRQSAGEA